MSQNNQLIQLIRYEFLIIMLLEQKRIMKYKLMILVDVNCLSKIPKKNCLSTIILSD